MAAETKTSVVRSATYTEKSWINPNPKNPKNATTYYHAIAFDNGDEGEYGASVVAQTKFITGQSVTYTIESVTRGTFTKNVIRPLYQPNGGGGGFQRKELDPKVQHAIAKMVCYECSLDYLKQLDATKVQSGHDYSVAKFFLKWMTSKGITGDIGKMASNALRRAIQSMPLSSIRIPKETTHESVIAKADEIFNYFNAE